MITGTTLKTSGFKAFIALSIIFGATVFCYHTVLANFFHGDDFVHLAWLSMAVKNPDLIWRNFHSAWLDISTARFYRPLISLFMVVDYLLWHGNGTGFHITNLVCHLLNTILLWRIIMDLPRNLAAGQQEGHINVDRVEMWALASAALFALYPLHPEAVSWITGRVDTIVTMFCLGSLWCYMRWRLTKKCIWLVAAAIGLMLGLLSKEMAIIMPAMFTIYEVVYGGSSLLTEGTKTNSAMSMFKIAHKALERTAWFWLILAGYFAVRRLALGTFIGGYDDSLFAITNKSIFVKNWLHSVNMTLVPINKCIFGARNPLKYLWLTLLAASLFCGAMILIRQWQERRHIIFFAGWLLLSLLPIFKLFNIGDDLEGSRLIYFGSVPLCALLTFGLTNFSFVDSNHISQWQKLLRSASGVLLFLILLVAGAILTINNLAWQQAGEVSRAIVQQLDVLYRTTNGDPPVYLVGLADNISGAYVCRNALDGMTKFPQICRSVHNCFMLTNADHNFPYGFARASIANDSTARVLRWHNDEKLFRVLSLPVNVESITPSWVQEPLLEKKAENKSLLLSVTNLPCWAAHIVTIRCKSSCTDSSIDQAVISLMYTNDCQKEFLLSRRVASALKNSSSEQLLVFPMHSDVDWSMGGNCHKLKLLFPGQWTLKVDKLEITPPFSMMPKLSMQNTANQNKLGYVQLNQQYPSCQLDFDATQMSQASTVTLEISKPNIFFETPNSTAPDNNVAISHKYVGKKGHILLALKDFPTNGIYQARLRAFDAQKNPCGFAGDQIMITVNK